MLASASWDAESGEVVVRQEPLRWPLTDTAARRRETLAGRRADIPALPLAVAAHALDPAEIEFGGHYNGKIDRLRLTDGVLDEAGIAAQCASAPTAALAARSLGFWDFAIGMGSLGIRDLSAWRRDGVVVNLPTRAMAGFNWSGEIHDPKQAPEQYGAIHFHEDDLYDAGWESDFAWIVPADCPSGCYAVKLEDGNLPGYVLFYVRPPRNARPGTRPRVAFLAATAHYLAYANYRLTDRDPMSEAYRGRLWQFGPEDVLLHQRPDFGNSMYDAHSDGSGVSISSYLRPVVNLRPNTRLASLSGDTYVLAFLRQCGYGVDVITDEDLHREGAGVLAPYRLPMTGGHPEYISREMGDGMTAFLGRGGR